MSVKGDRNNTVPKSGHIKENVTATENAGESNGLGSPPDGGWGWVVAGGAAIIQMQVATIATTFGVYFAELTQSPDGSPCNKSSASSHNLSSTSSWNTSSISSHNFSSPASSTNDSSSLRITDCSSLDGIPAWLVSWIPAIMLLIMFTVCPVSSALSKHYSHRQVAMTGAIFLTLSTFLAMAVDNFYWFFVVFSVFSGFGCGFILVQGNVCVQKYFKKRRGTANGIFMAGGALGNMVMPVILRYALAVFGFRGAVLVHACFLSLTIPAAAIFRPLPHVHPTETSNIQKAKDEEIPNLQKEYDEEAPNLQTGNIEATPNFVKGKSDTNEETSNESSGQIGVIVCGIWLPRIGDIFSWKIIRNPLFLLLTFTVVTARTAMRGFGMLVPAFGLSIGLDEDTSAFLLTSMAFADLSSRLISPLIGDTFPNLQKKWIYATFLSLMTISTLMFGTFVNDLKTTIAACVIFGLGIGGAASYMSILFVDGLGIDKVQDTIPLMYLLTGFCSFPVLPVLGAGKDFTGDFRVSFLLLALFVGLGMAVWGLEHRLDKYKFKEKIRDAQAHSEKEIHVKTIQDVQSDSKDNKAYIPDVKTS